MTVPCVDTSIREDKGEDDLRALHYKTSSSTTFSRASSRIIDVRKILCSCINTLNIIKY